MDSVVFIKFTPAPTPNHVSQSLDFDPASCGHASPLALSFTSELLSESETAKYRSMIGICNLGAKINLSHKS
jgi:hypothetical protein